MEQQIGLLLKLGFVVTDFFEDHWDHEDPINKFIPAFFNVRAQKQ